MANLSHKQVVSAFEKRYDYQSARNVLNLAISAGGLSAKDNYSDAELAKIGEGLKSLGERESETVIEALASGNAGGAAAAAPAADAKADDKKDAKADDKKDAKADDKKDDKKDAKADDKKDAKADDKKKK